uniref:Lactamase_B domain-containing protein n=1 Tax=Syphacia muris TaxID=451379 RepID=A0A0N5AIB1_9BILA
MSEYPPDTFTIEYPYSVKKISSYTYCIIENDDISWNPLIYLINSTKKALLIDTGSDTANLKAFLFSSGLINSVQKLIVVNTHSHPQQASGGYLFSTTGARGLADQVEAYCASEEFNNSSQVNNTGFEWQVKTYKVTRWLSHNDVLLLGSGKDCSNKVRVFHTPGHTPDSITLWYECDRRLFLGDLFYRFDDILMMYETSSLKHLENSVRWLVTFVSQFEKSNQCLVKYSSAKSEPDGKCLPALKNYHRFLLSIIAGTHYKLPTQVSDLDAVKYETRNKDMSLIISNEMNNELIEAQRKVEEHPPEQTSVS